MRAHATLGGGCFWCLEPEFSALKGVEQVVPGYAGGRLDQPSYEEVCEGTTGHAEVIQVTFDPAVISFADLLRVFFTIHDPTTLDRQGADVGPQYRSIILGADEEQLTIAREVIAEVTAAGWWDEPIVTEVARLENFYPAETYHHDYFNRNPAQPYCRMVIAPKLAKFRQHFAAMLKE
jgi:peptide-methionine (S)-S-oxide reductase